MNRLFIDLLNQKYTINIQICNGALSTSIFDLHSLNTFACCFSLLPQCFHSYLSRDYSYSDLDDELRERLRKLKQNLARKDKPLSDQSNMVRSCSILYVITYTLPTELVRSAVFMYKI